MKLASILLILILFACQSDHETFKDNLKISELNGNGIDMSTFDNKVIILNLWATWCVPCIREMPDLEKMEKLLGEDFVLVLASDQPLDKLNEFVKRKPFDLHFVKLAEGMEQLGIHALPTTLIIGKDGNLKETIVGAKKWDGPEQIEYLNTFLK